MVEGMSNFSLDFYLCEHFLYWKHNRVRLSYGVTRQEEILYFVHKDMFEPVESEDCPTMTSFFPKDPLFFIYIYLPLK